MQLDGHEQCRLDHDQRRCSGQRQRLGELQRGRQHWHDIAHRDDDDRRTDLHGDASWRALHVHHLADVVESHDVRGGDRHGHRHGRHGLQLDGREQRGWITISAGASGSGNGSVSYSVAPTPGTTSRTGTMTIGGQTFTVTQAGAPCTFTISPTSSNLTTSAAATGTRHRDRGHGLRLDGRE